MRDEIGAVERKIEEQIRLRDMLPNGCAAVIGLSGGADSVALTHFLVRYAAEHEIRLLAAHVNHGLRGAEADRDEEFVRGFCGQLGMGLRILRADVRAQAEKASQGLEECGRNVRYSFFRSLCEKDGKIATAHTLSDSAETVVLNLARGAGPRGLAGIPPVRGDIIRPLIAVTRAEVEQYCLYYDLDYITDSSNLTDEYARNRVRRHVIPMLRQLNPGFEESVFRMSEILRSGEEYLTECAKERLCLAVRADGCDLSVLRETPEAVLSRMIPMILASQTKARQEYGHIEAVKEIILSGRGSVTVAGGIQCSADGNTLTVSPQNRKGPSGWEVPLKIPRTVLPGGRVLLIERIPPETLKNRGKINNLFFNNLVSYDTILNNSHVRSRKNGDRFRPFGRGVTKTLKKMFNEEKIPLFLRDRVAVLESGGKIIWVEGFGVSEEAGIAYETENVAKITIKECSGSAETQR